MDRFTNNTFSSSFITTLGTDFRRKTVQLANGLEINANIWDLAGQERFHSAVSSTYRGTNGFVLVYDVGCQQSLERLLEHWIPEVLRYCDPEHVKFILVGNKWDHPDLELDGDMIQRAEQIAHHYKMPCCFASAKANTNITAIYDNLISQIARHAIMIAQKADDDAKAKSLVVVDEDTTPKKGFCCFSD